MKLVKILLRDLGIGLLRCLAGAAKGIGAVILFYAAGLILFYALGWVINWFFELTYDIPSVMALGATVAMGGLLLMFLLAKIVIELDAYIRRVKQELSDD